MPNSSKNMTTQGGSPAVVLTESQQQALELMDRMGPELRRVAFSVVKNLTDTKDVLQEVSTKILSTPHAWAKDSERHLFNCLCVTVRRMALDWLEDKRSSRMISDPRPHERSDVLEGRVAIDADQAVDTASIDLRWRRAFIVRHIEQLAPLAPRRADVLRMYFGGLSLQEIGERLGIAVPTVKKHLYLAKCELKRRGKK